MVVELIAKTQGLGRFENQSIDNIIVGQARVSTSRELNDLFDEPHKLLNHCILNQHWSIFDLANLGFYIETSRAMGREFLRHWTIHPTEFSQRYSSNISMEGIELRVQSKNNRQSSTEAFNPTLQILNEEWEANKAIDFCIKNVEMLYEELLSKNTARETARFILPETTTTQMYFNGTIRSWITFLNARLHQTAQKEIRLIAEQIRDIFIQECPIISKSLFNFENAYEIHILERIVLEKYKVYQTVINK
jgi:thymidylate synthase (FAD)